LVGVKIIYLLIGAYIESRKWWIYMLVYKCKPQDGV